MTHRLVIRDKGDADTNFEKNDASASMQEIDTGFRSRKATASSYHQSHQG